MKLAGAVALLPLAGCAALPPEPVGAVVVPSEEVPADLELEWQRYASAEDVARIGRIDAAWAEGLATVREAGFVTAVEEEGALLDPQGGLQRPDPTPGSYRCRLVKLGAAEAGDPAFIAYPAFFCYVEIEEDRFTIVKQTGSQRPAGRLFEAERRYIFLGSLALGNEREPLAYGEETSRDMAGVWERVGPFRWRLAIPYPRSGGVMDVFELVPTADQP
ncbi:DUF4893 domain-containing protein [Sphingomicrobium aestuariivivum]|uniref:DUF4893 domain-containing protein n=1 Tax=Sphingomicrobium aestuariivivum TaxID=1582356 RepID=UPI001FD6F430|nr:DUF4893 domain-containing protein [Sphingomicrobium aestuariivivum]MCJ8191514.1 DUF4893 domain-containing protein [Sphingomicrobium aestuariivivum]